MAEGGRALTPRRAADRDRDRGWKLGLGLGAAALLWLFLGGAFIALFAGAGKMPEPAALLADAYLRGVVVFTLEQAFLSALLSVAGAIPLALALHRTRFAGRGLVLRLFLLPQALPVLVGGLAILALWGRGGVLSEIAVAAGLPRLNVYGLAGILIAHVFFNMPLAARLVFAALDAVPAESWRLAGQLALPPATVFRLIEWPALRRALPGAASLAFMICVTSFTLVLVLGGGPGATTLEVEIYRALRTDFDPGRAVILSLVQIALTAIFLGIASGLGGRLDVAFTLGRETRRFDRRGSFARTRDAAVVATGLLFILSPFAVVVIRGLRADLARLLMEPAVREAALTSAAIGFSSASLAAVLSLALLFGREALRDGQGAARAAGRFVTLSGSLVLVVPPIVIGAGWFLFLAARTDVFALAPAMVIGTNAMMAMPFVIRIAGPPLAEALVRHRRLAGHLGLSGWSRLRHVEGPALAGPLSLAFALALALSLGDLGVVALFGSESFTTLPYLLYQRMGSYRTADAAGLALILGALALGLVVGAERGFASAGRSARQ